MNNFLKIFGLIVLVALLGGAANHYIFTDASEKGEFFLQSEQSHREYYFDLFDVETVRHASIESEYPTRAIPDESQSITDLQYRVNSIPFADSAERHGYVVYPKHGITTPVSIPNAIDQEKIRDGKTFNHYPYLDIGGIHYRGKSPSEGFGNMVIAAHSSYLKDSPGNYKTVFQALPISKKGDTVLYYEKNDNGTYDLYTYIITDSFRTSMDDISVLAQTNDENFLTTYGCYVIGDNSERRINHSVLESVTKNIVLSKTPGINNNLASAPVEAPTQAPDPVIAPIPKPTQVKPAITETSKTEPSKSIDHAAAEEPVAVAAETSKAPTKEIPTQITALIPEKLLPQLEVLVQAIDSRLVTSPELQDRVQTRLTQKIVSLKDASSTAEITRLAIYLYIEEGIDWSK